MKSQPQNRSRLNDIYVDVCIALVTVFVISSVIAACCTHYFLVMPEPASVCGTMLQSKRSCRFDTSPDNENTWILTATNTSVTTNSMLMAPPNTVCPPAWDSSSSSCWTHIDTDTNTSVCTNSTCNGETQMVPLGAETTYTKRSTLHESNIWDFSAPVCAPNFEFGLNSYYRFVPNYSSSSDWER